MGGIPKALKQRRAGVPRDRKKNGRGVAEDMSPRPCHPPQASHGRCCCRGPISVPEAPTPGMALPLPHLPPGLGSVGRVTVESSPLDTFD